MRSQVIDIHSAKTHFSRLVARAEKGERIIIARNGRPAAQLIGIPKSKNLAVSPDDPLFHLNVFGFDGSGRRLDNREIDRALYRK